MTHDEAELFLASYKVLLKQWTMVAAGILDGDSEALHQHLKNELSTLIKISKQFPDKAYTVEVLTNALTNVGSTPEVRSLRPDNRFTK